MRALYRSCVSLCQDPSNGTGSLVACLRVYSVAPAGAYVGIPITILGPWVRAGACTLSLLRELVSGSQTQYWILRCVLACTLCRPCGSLLLDLSVGTGFPGEGTKLLHVPEGLKKGGRASSWRTSQWDSKKEGTQLVHVPEGQQKEGHQAGLRPRRTAKGEGHQAGSHPRGTAKRKGTRLVHVPCGSLCWDPINGAGSLGACLPLEGVCAGIPAATLDP